MAFSVVVLLSQEKQNKKNKPNPAGLKCRLARTVKTLKKYIRVKQKQNAKL